MHDINKKVLLKNNVQFHLSVAAGGGGVLDVGDFFFIYVLNDKCTKAIKITLDRLNGFIYIVYLTAYSHQIIDY